jgi:hypothetical protein
MFVADTGLSDSGDGVYAPGMKSPRQAFPVSQELLDAVHGTEKFAAMSGGRVVASGQIR